MKPEGFKNIWKAHAVCFAAIMAGVLLGVLIKGCYSRSEPPKMKSDTVYVKRIVEKHDSFPVERVVTVIEKVKIPAAKKDTCGVSLEESDSVELEVVQKEYSDDSTYTAYVSGVRYGDYPRLDSVIVRQKMIEKTITNTIYERKRGLKVKLRPAVGGGYDPLNRNWGVYIGGAVILDW